jgi:hypothetical protein
MAVRTGLEPATLGVTGRYSNQLNYRTKFGADVSTSLHQSVFRELINHIRHFSSTLFLKNKETFAEAVGFEPTEPFSSTVFKTAAIDHSAKPPNHSHGMHF